MRSMINIELRPYPPSAENAWGQNIRNKCSFIRVGDRDAHPTGSDPSLGIVTNQCANKVHVEYCTHLAISFGRNVEINQDKNNDCEAGQARS